MILAGVDEINFDDCVFLRQPQEPSLCTDTQTNVLIAYRGSGTHNAKMAELDPASIADIEVLIFAPQG